MKKITKVFAVFCALTVMATTSIVLASAGNPATENPANCISEDTGSGFTEGSDETGYEN